MAQAAKLARLVDPTVLKFDPHPVLDAYAALWTCTDKPTPRGDAPVSAGRERALREVASRSRQALDADQVIAQALASVSWKTVARLPTSASRQRLLFHKIKGLRLSGWNRVTNRRGCPHCPAPGAGVDTGHTFHIMWHCASAQALWTQLRESWERLGAIFDGPAFWEAVFSLRLPLTPHQAWSILDLRGDQTELVTKVNAVVALVWQQQVLGCLQQIWSWRHGMADEALPWTLDVASSALRSSLRAAYHQVGASLTPTNDHRADLQRLLHGLQGLQLTPDRLPSCRLLHATDKFLLFFDGGSRGNPGAGGAGAVVVRVDAFGGALGIEWAAAMSLAKPTTTNNQAEYVGLVTGLRYASAKRLRPLTIIGDSAMIISQLQQHRAPQAPVLRRYYAQARVMADVLGVTQWRHHVRAFNKMADCAANLAMDSKCSAQTQHPTSRPFWAPIATHLHDDVAPWQASTQFGQTSTG